MTIAYVSIWDNNELYGDNWHDWEAVHTDKDAAIAFADKLYEDNPHHFRKLSVTVFRIVLDKPHIKPSRVFVRDSRQRTIFKIRP